MPTTSSASRILALSVSVLLLAAGILAGCSPASTPSLGQGGSGGRPLPSSSSGVQQRVLENGLTVLVVEDHSSPLATIVTQINSGYFDEEDDQAGISHLLEHMIFHGGETNGGATSLSQSIEGLGGSLNAGTIYDRTTFYSILPGEHFDAALALWADAFQHPRVEAALLSREKEAVRREAQRKLENPIDFGRETLFEMAFPHHRMGRWRLGDEEVLERIDVADVRRFHQDHHRPANTILTIVGDVSAKRVFEKVEELFGAWPRGELRKHMGPDVAPQDELRYARITAELGQNYIFTAFHTPGLGHDDNPALEVLAAVLGAGRGSQLMSQLKERQGVAIAIEAHSYQYGEVGVFEIDAIVDDRDVERSVRELFIELERIKQFGVNEADLARAKTYLAMRRARQNEDMVERASVLAHAAGRGDAKLVDADMVRIQAVSSDDLVRVARQYFAVEKANILEYVGQRVEAEQLTPALLTAHLKGSLLAAAEGLYALDAVEWGYSYLPREEIDAWAARFSKSKAGQEGIDRFVYENGAVLLVKTNPSASSVSAGTFFRGGRIVEVPNTAGVAHLMQRLMIKQSQNRDQVQLTAEIESMGSGIEMIGADDYLGFSVSSLRGDMPRAFDMLFDITVNPRVSNDQVDREKEAHLATMAGIHDRSEDYAKELLRKALYGDHPYGFGELGTDMIVRMVRNDRMEDFHFDLVNPANAVIVVAGNVDAALVHELVGAYMTDWDNLSDLYPAGAEAFYGEDNVDPAPALLGGVVEEVSRDREEAIFWLAYPTVARSHPDRHALEVLQSVTARGGVLDGLRESGARWISSFEHSMALGGYLGCAVACDPDRVTELRGAVANALESLAEDLPDSEVLERAKRQRIGRDLIALQSNGAQLRRLAQLELLGLDSSEYGAYAKRIQAVSREDLGRVLRDHLVGKPHAVGLIQGNLDGDVQ